MSFKQKFSITLVLSVFALLIAGILYSYQLDPGGQSKLGTTRPPGSLHTSPSRLNRHVQPSRLPSKSEISLVTRIIDGDTFEIETKQKVRLIGIDTPELNKSNNLDPECFGIQAAQKLSDLILNKKVRMEKDISETDRFGRLLRYVYVGNIFINQQLIESGFAFAKNYPPDSTFKEKLTQAQKSAQENKRGLWKECN